MRAIATTIRDRVRNWWGQYQAGCAQLDEAMRALDQKWRGQYQTWLARYHEQLRQPACYSLIAVQRYSAVAKWLAGLSAAATVLAFSFYVQSYLSILSIKNDCASLRFVADANYGAVWLARGFLLSGTLALVAIALPTAVGIGRNVRRWRKALKMPPLQPGHDFDEWSEYQVTKNVTSWQCALVFFSAVFFFGLTLMLVFSETPTTPDGILKEWHNFELQCLQAKP